MSELCPHGRIWTAFCAPCAAQVEGYSVSRTEMPEVVEAQDKLTKRYRDIVDKDYIEAERTPTGLDAQYYDLPDNIKSAQDLIEYLGLNFANGNILKSLVRQYGSATKGTDEIYEVEKRFFFAQRELQRVQREKEVRRRLPDATEGDKAP